MIDTCPQPHLKAGDGDESVVCGSIRNYFVKQVVLLSCAVWRVWGQTCNFWKLAQVRASSSVLCCACKAWMNVL